MLVSPVLEWRDEVSIAKGTCVALCLLHRFKLGRISISLEVLFDEVVKQYIEEKGRHFTQESAVVRSSDMWRPSPFPPNVHSKLELLSRKVAKLEERVAQDSEDSEADRSRGKKRRRKAPRL